MPTGIQPPVVVQFNATSVPVLQLSLTSDTLNEQQLYDYGLYQMRQALAPIPGITLPTPYGGRYRQIMVDLDPDKLRAYGLTPTDVVNAVNAQIADAARGRRQAGHPAVHRPSQRHGADARRARGRADPPERRHDGVSCMTWRMSATAGRCSRTSSGPTASVRCC